MQALKKKKKEIKDKTKIRAFGFSNGCVLPGMHTFSGNLRCCANHLTQELMATLQNSLPTTAMLSRKF